MQGFPYFSGLPVLHCLQVVFIKICKNVHEYLIQHSLKSGGTKDQFRRLKISGTAPFIERPVNDGYVILKIAHYSNSTLIVSFPCYNSMEKHVYLYPTIPLKRAITPSKMVQSKCCNVI